MGFLGQPKRLGPRWAWRSATFLLGSACAFLFVAPAMAATAAPEVGYLAASHVSTTGATIEVPINPEGGETRYEIWLECQSAQGNNQGCGPLTVGPQRQQGILSPGFEPQIVTDAVTGLQPGYLYKYGVIATNSAGREGYIGNGFLTCPSQDTCPRQPFLVGESLWNLEGAEREAKEAPRIGAEEAARQREAEERPVKEVAERAAKEREIREAGERAGKEAAERAASTHSPTCVVPRLRGDSLTEARRALGRAHCRLGRLTEPRGYRGPLVVVKQSVHGGSKLAAGLGVALTLSRDGKR
jgi:hypothetical protein